MTSDLENPGGDNFSKANPGRGQIPSFEHEGPASCLSAAKRAAHADFEKGRSAFSEQEYDKAARLFAAAIEGDSTSEKYYFMYGVSLSRSGNYKEAAQALNRAYQMKSFDPNTLAELGHVYSKLGLRTRAGSCFDLQRRITSSDESLLEDEEVVDEDNAANESHPLERRRNYLDRLRESLSLLKRRLAPHFRFNKELAIVLFLVGVAGFVFFFISHQRAFLNFFYLPVLVGAYFFGKRYATHSALFSIILVSLIAYLYPSTFLFNMEDSFNRWLDILTWGSFLLVTAYYMGLLYEKKEFANREVKDTYHGIIELMSVIIDSAEKAAQNHSYRVSVISGIIAREMCLPEIWIENIRIAALLHDWGKVGLSKEVLKKINGVGRYEQTAGTEMLEPVCEKILDVLPLILYHREKFNGDGDLQLSGEEIPLGARIIAVADTFDSLLTGNQGRVNAQVAKANITKLAGTDFDPRIVRAFLSVFPKLNSGHDIRRKAS